MSTESKTEPTICEQTQNEISAWIDGELEAWNTLPLADHLVRCADCSAFYGRARSLERALAIAPASAAPTPSPHTWARIHESASSWARITASAPGRARMGESASLAPWALPVAATVLLAIGGLTLLGKGGFPPFGDPVTGTRPVSSGDRPAAHMTDARFVGITRELLQSEPRYRAEMLRVMAEVAEHRPPEGTVDAVAPTNDAAGDVGERANRAPGS